jgi:hypothetical protein
MTRASRVSRPWLLGAMIAVILAFGSTPTTLSQSPTQSPAKPQTPPATTPAAQTSPAPPVYMRLNVVDVRPDMMADYVALQKAESIPALQKGGVEWRDAWRAGNFGSPFTIAYISPITSFAAFDGPTPIEKALGADGAQQYMAKIAKMVNGSRVYAIRARPDLGYKGPEGMAMPKLGILASVEVMAGRQPDFEMIIKNEWTPALKKAGVPMYNVSEVVYGGAIGEYYTFTPLENYAQLDKGHPIQQVIGEAGLMKLMAKLGPHIRHAERMVLRYDEELSFRTKVVSQLR